MAACLDIYKCELWQRRNIGGKKQRLAFLHVPFKLVNFRKKETPQLILNIFFHVHFQNYTSQVWYVLVLQLATHQSECFMKFFTHPAFIRRSVSSLVAVWHWSVVVVSSSSVDEMAVWEVFVVVVDGFGGCCNGKKGHSDQTVGQ